MPFSILAVGSFPQTQQAPARQRQRGGLSVSSLLDRFLRLSSAPERTASNKSFSILAVGSFPQTSGCLLISSGKLTFQYPRCWIVSSDLTTSTRRLRDGNFQYPRCWIVSSDLEVAKAIATYVVFQYPRCWIVSSDLQPCRIAL